MEAPIHFARLDVPAEAFRCRCGEWRAASAWTTSRKAVTCRICIRLLAEQERLLEAPAGDAAHPG